MPFDGYKPNVRVSRGKRFDIKRDYSFVPVDRLDAAENLFLDRSLRHMIPQIFNVEYGTYNARSIFPVYFANDPGAEVISYRQGDGVGEAAIVRDYADDAPTVEVSTGEFDTKIRSLRVGAHWSIQELRAAARENVPLSEAKAAECRDAMLRKESKIAFLGDADFGLTGLLSASNGIPRVEATAELSGRTGDQNLTQIHTFVQTVPDGTEDIHHPDVLLLPPAQYDFLATQRIGDATPSDTAPKVLKDILDHSPHIRQIIRVRELKGAGTGGTDVAVAYKRDINILRMNVALDLEQFPPERSGMVVKVEYHMRVGGLTVTRPKAIAILEGI